MGENNTNSNSTEPKVFYPGQNDKGEVKQNSSQKILLLIFAGILVVVLIVIGSIIYYQNHHKKQSAVATTKVVNGVCSASMLKSADASLAPTQTKTLAPIVASIQKLPNYQYDPNCLYILVSYYANTSNTASASMYLNDLEKVYKPYQPFSKYIGVDSIAPLQAKVAYLVKATNQAKKDIVTFPSH
jgi:hypothetical protein